MRTQETGIFFGLKWQGNLYFDLTMPMGWRSVAMCCQGLANAIRYVLRSHGFYLVTYLDDMVTAECWDKAEACFSALREIFVSMGVVEARSKAVGPCKRMNFLDISFDIEQPAMKERVSECTGLLMEWLGKSKVTRKEVESLVRMFSFIVKPGRIISRLLEYLRGLPKMGKVTVPGSVRKDSLW